MAVRQEKPRSPKVLSRWIRLRLARADRIAKETLRLYDAPENSIEADMLGGKRRRVSHEAPRQ
jgi:hypothetical protein